MTEDRPLFGIMAQFDSPEALVEAAERAREAGYTQTESYSPYPIDELTDPRDIRSTRVPLIVLVGGILGGAGGFLMEY
jgi:hypothetical protein